MTLVIGLPKVKEFFLSLLYIFIFDAIWFSLALYLKIYPTNNLPSPQYKIFLFSLIAYIPLAIAISCLEAENQSEAAQYGAFIGVLTYMVFNGVELATRSDWSTYNKGLAPLADISWGTVNLTLNSWLVYISINGL